jgi:hypothetical protein
LLALVSPIKSRENRAYSTYFSSHKRADKDAVCGYGYIVYDRFLDIWLKRLLFS